MFRQRGREREREGEKNQYVADSHVPPTGDLAPVGMCPDWDGARDTLVHRPELNPLSHTSQGALVFF